jgi:hypothetical protein
LKRPSRRSILTANPHVIRAMSATSQEAAGWVNPRRRWKNQVRRQPATTRTDNLQTGRFKGDGSFLPILLSVSSSGRRLSASGGRLFLSGRVLFLEGPLGLALLLKGHHIVFMVRSPKASSCLFSGRALSYSDSALARIIQFTSRSRPPLASYVERWNEEAAAKPRLGADTV